MSGFQERTTGKIVDACAEWDDPHGFCVYLIREDEEGQPDFDHSQRMRAVMSGDSVEARIYLAAFVAHPNDHRDLVTTSGEPIRWTTRSAAERAARAVLKELKRIEAGKPGPRYTEVYTAATVASMLRKGRRS